MEEVFVDTPIEGKLPGQRAKRGTLEITVCKDKEEAFQLTLWTARLKSISYSFNELTTRRILKEFKILLESDEDNHPVYKQSSDYSFAFFLSKEKWTFLKPRDSITVHLNQEDLNRIVNALEEALSSLKDNPRKNREENLLQRKLGV